MVFLQSLWNALETVDAKERDQYSSLFPTNSEAIAFDPKLYSIALGLEPSPTSQNLPVDLPPHDGVHHGSTVSHTQILSFLPSQEECRIMMKNYLDTVEGTHRLFHLPTLKRELADFWLHPEFAEHDWLSQYFMMLALGYRTPDEDHRTLWTGVETNSLSSIRKLVIAARVCLQKSSYALAAKNTIIRALALMAILIQAKGHSCQNIDACRPWLDMAARHCRALGHHKAWRNVPSLSNEDDFVARRIWITVSYLLLRQSMSSGSPLLLLPSDYKNLRLENLNDEDVGLRACYLSEPMACNWTEGTNQALLAESLHTAVDIVSRANAPSDEHNGGEAVNYDTVLEYDALLRRLLHASSVAAVNPCSGGEFADSWPTRQHLLITIFLRRLLLILHLPFADKLLMQTADVDSTQSPVGRLVDRWSLLENSLAILVAQRSMFEYVPNVGSGNMHMDIYEELLKQDFFIAALVCGIQIKSESQDEPSQARSHGIQSKTDEYHDQHRQPELGVPSQPTKSPRQTVLQALESCRTIWGRRLRNQPGEDCSFWIYIVLGKIIDSLGEGLGT
ncbi:hypothetical protein RBB50_010983 [Rhinocladiella similis]